MRTVLRGALVLLVPVWFGAQGANLPVPPNVLVDGVPPIPMSLVDAVAPYADFRQARFLAWHPVERRMLVSTAFGNAPQVHQVRMPGGARTQLTFYADGARGEASYHPSGRSFVFQKDTGGGAGLLQLFRYDFAAGSATLLTDGQSRNGVPVRARTSGRIAYDSTRRNGRDRDLWVMDPADPATNRLLAEGQGIWRVADWSPDDREVLAIESISAASETYLWRIDVATGRKTAVTARGGTPIAWSSARFTPDGRAVLAVGTYESERPRLMRYELVAGRWSAVSAPGDAVDAFDLSRDGRLIALVVDRGATSELRLIDARTGRPRATPPLPPGTITSLAWHANGGDIAFTYAGARTFSDVYSLNAQSGKVDRWTASEIGGANPESLPDAEVISWKSFDGLTIPGVLYRPAARFTGPRPVIINVHGGPALRERPRGLGRSNYFRNEMGIAVIYPNIRGSAGFGRAFEQADNATKREDAIKDIGALLDWIATQPHLDKSRVMITGSSYGGYVTYASAIAYGDRIRCAFAGFGISDFITYMESTEESRRIDRKAEYGDPADPAMHAFLKRISPLSQASKLRIPLFIAQGGKDTSVPLGQAQTMVKAVKGNGTPLWYVVYQDAGHEQLTAATNNFNIYAWILFAQQYLVN